MMCIIFFYVCWFAEHKSWRHAQERAYKKLSHVIIEIQMILHKMMQLKLASKQVKLSL